MMKKAKQERRRCWLCRAGSYEDERVGGLWAKQDKRGGLSRCGSVEDEPGLGGLAHPPFWVLSVHFV